MRKAALLYNPTSGRRHGRRLADVEAALAVLRGAGVEASASSTLGASQAAEQTRQAIADGCDAVFACGGDGTVHDVLQGLIGTSAALAIIPFGTANTLAHDLGVPLSTADAARAALAAKPRRIAVGRVGYRDLSGNPASRYFAVTVGVGMDAYLFHALDSSAKVHFGMLAYYARATRLWLTQKMESFVVSFASAAGQSEPAEVSQLLAVRIRDFGGALRELAPGAALEREDLRLVLFRTRSRLAYLRYITRGFLGAKWSIPGVELVYSTGATCLSKTGAGPIYVEADGEILGTLPVEIGVVPQAVTVLAP